MHSTRLIGAIAGTLTLACAGAAVAQTASNSTLDIAVKPGSASAGSKNKPTQQPKLSVAIAGGTKDGKGQPASSRSIDVTLPAAWRFNAAKWPKSKRCDVDRVNKDRNTRSCPAASKVGVGSSAAKVGYSPTKNGFPQFLTLTAFVTKKGGIGFFVFGTKPAVVARMLDGKVTGKKLSVAIPPVFRSSVGLPIGITDLSVKLNGKIKVGKGKKAKTYGITQSTGCMGGKWTFKVASPYVGGGTGAGSDTVGCHK